jgi:WD40 repeat protein
VLEKSLAGMDLKVGSQVRANQVPTTPTLNQDSKPVAPKLDRYPTANIEKLNSLGQIQAHDGPISALKFHPRKPILATVSDDCTWKLWSFPQGELILSGTGHQGWISDCDFHPKGHQLATSSGDGTVKIWDFAKGVAVSTIADHNQPVWSVGFDELGQRLATGSMDTTIKLFDLSRYNHALL